MSSSSAAKDLVVNMLNRFLTGDSSFAFRMTVFQRFLSVVYYVYVLYAYVKNKLRSFICQRPAKREIIKGCCQSSSSERGAVNFLTGYHKSAFQSEKGLVRHASVDRKYRPVGSARHWTTSVVFPGYGAQGKTGPVPAG